MMPKYHIAIGLLISSLLVYFLNLSLLTGIIIFLSSWLFIDLDHYFRYVYLTKNFSLVGFYRWSIEKHKKFIKLSENQKEKYKKPIFIFHSIEFWFVLFLLSFLSKIFIWVLVGFAIHMIADYIDISYYKEKIYPKFSLIYTLIKNKNKKDFI